MCASSTFQTQMANIATLVEPQDVVHFPHQHRPSHCWWVVIFKPLTGNGMGLHGKWLCLHFCHSEIKRCQWLSTSAAGDLSSTTSLHLPPFTSLAAAMKPTCWITAVQYLKEWGAKKLISNKPHRCWVEVFWLHQMKSFEMDATFPKHKAESKMHPYLHTQPITSHQQCVIRKANRCQNHHQIRRMVIMPHHSPPYHLPGHWCQISHASDSHFYQGLKTVIIIHCWCQNVSSKLNAPLMCITLKQWFHQLSLVCISPPWGHLNAPVIGWWSSVDGFCICLHGCPMGTIRGHIWWQKSLLTLDNILHTSLSIHLKHLGAYYCWFAAQILVLMLAACGHGWGNGLICTQCFSPCDL